MTNRQQKVLAGRSSGNARLKEFGRNYFSEIGKLGGRPRVLNIDELRARMSGSNMKNEGGCVNLTASPNN